MSPLRKWSETEAAGERHGWGSIRFFAGTKLSGTSGISGARVVINRGAANVRHSHPSCDEVLYLLKGRLKHYVGADAYEMEPGDSIAIPTGVPHYAINTGEEAADMLVFYSAGERDLRVET